MRACVLQHCRAGRPHFDRGATSMRIQRISFSALALIGLGFVALGLAGTSAGAAGGFLATERDSAHPYDAQIRDYTRNLISEGRTTFRYDTLGSERFFGNTIGLTTATEA